MPDPYAELADLAELELELVRSERHEELETLADRRAAVVDGLPGAAPPAARPLLARALSFQVAVNALLEARMRAVASELARLDRGRSGARAYAPGAPRPERLDRAG